MADRVLVNFRLESGLVEDMDAAAARAGLNRTEWVRSIITVAVRAELQRVTTAVAARVPPGAIEGCAHPKHLREWNGRGLVCVPCGTVLERRYKGA